MASEDLLPCKRNYKKEKLMRLFTTHEYADCFFNCGAERVPAHKIILACSSPVFESMFYGHLAASEIDLPDINPEDFKEMLEYIYTDEIDIKSVTSAWGLIYICQKYFLTNLLDVCVDYVRNNLNVSNLIMSYEYSQLYNHQELTKVCWMDITRYAKGILLNNDYHMKQSTLRFILSQSVINASESDLVMVAVKWAMEECTIKEIDLTYENVWNILLDSKILHLLNLSKFESVQYETTVYLSHKEMYYNIRDLWHFVNLLICYYRDEISARACSEYRTLPKQLNYKFRDSYKISKNIIFFDTFHVVNVIAPARPVYLFGVAITTLHRPEKAETNSYTGGVQVKLSCNAHNFFKYIEMNVHLDYDDVQYVNFPIPVRLDVGNKYHIIVGYDIEHQYDRGEVLLHYMSQTLPQKTTSTVINFSDELEGSVVKAVNFYPA